MRTKVYMFFFALLALATAHAQPAGSGGGDDNRILHKQVLHQYIVQEAFKILQSVAPRAAVKLQDHIGAPTQPVAPWVEKTVIAGAFREDEEDITFSYGGPVITYDPVIGLTTPGSCAWFVYDELENYVKHDEGFRTGFITAGHFWDPGASDNFLRKTDIALSGTDLLSCLGSPIELTIQSTVNAWTKADRMLNPGQQLAVIDFWWTPDEVFYNPTNDLHWQLPSTNDHTLELKIGYSSLEDLYNSGNCSLGFGLFPLTDGWRLSYTQRDTFVWEILGRICHLLTDMSVPAHTHKDTHAPNDIRTVPVYYPDPVYLGDVTWTINDADSYEQWVAHAGDGDVGNLSSIHWTAEMILTQYPTAPFIDPTNEQDPLYFLMNSMRALAASFASDDFDGTGGQGLPVYTTDFPFLHNVELDPPSSQVAVLSNIRDVTVPFCIRAVAGLLYWFANQLHREDDIYVYNTGVQVFSDFFYSEDPTNPSYPFTSYPSGSYWTKDVGDDMHLRSHPELPTNNVGDRSARRIPPLAGDADGDRCILRHRAMEWRGVPQRRNPMVTQATILLQKVIVRVPRRREK